MDEKRQWVVQANRMDLTVFTCNAVPKYRAPSVPMVLRSRISVVSACVT